MSESRALYCRRALLPEGWAEDVLLSIDGNGFIESIQTGQGSAPASAETAAGPVVPGVPNCHSHAFQRAMAGLAERRGGDDSFWGWRDAMYRLLQHIGPEQLQAIAEQLYVEMLRRGYTAVGEFHYLHHGPGGEFYADPAEMSHRVVAAAGSAGIHITLLPVLYCYSDFGARPAAAGQLRFLHSPQDYQALLERLHGHYRDKPAVRVGAAPHSLRAVDEPALREALIGLDGLDPTAPIHIHIAEQQREVQACVAHSGARPVAWLLDRFDVDARWCLVHATHIDAHECHALAASGAVAGLCPSTEANLGDGLFPAESFLAAGGTFAMGSDSQVTVDPAQELRLLEYGQRLWLRRRAVLAGDDRPSVGDRLFTGCVRGGARALGIATGELAPGARADLVVLDEQHPALYGRRGAALLDSWIFAGTGSEVKDVMVAGEWRVRDGAHPRQEEVAARFRSVVDALADVA